jgi:hypothetical protein
LPKGFGICPNWDPASESVEDFEQRICKLIGGSFSRSLEDGQWYLDLARGDYVLDDLPILTDDDILDFKEQPSTFDSAINSVSVRYFDPERKETIVTPPVRALGLVATFGTIHQTYDFPEIPTAHLATLVALRELLTTTTPTRGFDLVTTRRSYAWRPDQYFRLQAPKRGIADMVCLVGEKQSGTLKSGAIKLKATQDIYGLPATSFVQVEPAWTHAAADAERDHPAAGDRGALRRGGPSMTQVPTWLRSRRMRAFAMAVAVAPAGELDFTMMVGRSGGATPRRGHGEWCATATVVESTIGRTRHRFHAGERRAPRPGHRRHGRALGRRDRPRRCDRRRRRLDHARARLRGHRPGAHTQPAAACGSTRSASPLTARSSPTPRPSTSSC